MKKTILMLALCAAPMAAFACPPAEVSCENGTNIKIPQSGLLGFGCSPSNDALEAAKQECVTAGSRVRDVKVGKSSTGLSGVAPTMKSVANEQVAVLKKDMDILNKDMARDAKALNDGISKLSI